MIVGSSNVAVAFLEALIFTPQADIRLIFNNITLISPQGLPYQREGEETRDAMFVTKGIFSYKRMQLLSLRTYINIVNGVMTEIDRKQKRVIINYGAFVPYDYLFLMCGEQFQKPKIEMKKKRKAERFPQNVFIINSETDAASALAKVASLISEHENNPEKCKNI